MLKVGLNRIRDLHANDIDKAWVGTDGSAVSESQTGLITGVVATKLAVTVASTDKTNTISYTLDSTTGVGNTYREFAVIKDGVVEYLRVVFTGIQHTSSSDIIIRPIITYRNP